MAKNSRPEIDNPLANMGLDDIVRGITTPGKDKEPVVDANGDPAAERETKRRKRGKKAFEENLAKYTGISEQGFAIWLPKEVKKRLELIRLNAIAKRRMIHRGTAKNASAGWAHSIAVPYWHCSNFR